VNDFAILWLWAKKFIFDRQTKGSRRLDYVIHNNKSLVTFLFLQYIAMEVSTVPYHIVLNDKVLQEIIIGK
jgi:hypothetical protein